VDFVEERVRPVFAAVGFGADAVLEPAVASGFESARWGFDGLGCGYGEAGDKGFDGEHVGGLELKLLYFEGERRRWIIRPFCGREDEEEK